MLRCQRQLLPGACTRPGRTTLAHRDMSVIRPDHDVDRTLSAARDSDEITLTHMCEITRIAAPSGHEAERGRWFADRLADTGLTPHTDDAGNVMATTPASRPDAQLLVIAAHLDTVFPLDTPLDVRRDGSRLYGPGIADNARGLAGVLAIARALGATDWPLDQPLAIVGTVGEEGAGNLRGVKHFTAAHAGRIGAFIALDGAGVSRIITGGIGSRRLRFACSGPGGHSWSDFGRPNAIHDAARLIAALAALPLRPGSTLSVGRVAGGTSINAIPAATWFEVDLRAAEPEDLTETEKRVRACAADNADADRLDITVFGDRPAGRTDADQPLVRAAAAATRAVGATVEQSSSSTDANVPMALGIPAIAIGAGGVAGGSHTPAEWYDNDGGPAGIERALRLVLSLAGARPDRAGTQ